MDLDLTDEQEMLRDMVRGVCATYSPLAVVRELEDDATGYAPAFWQQLAALDLTGLLVPEAHGGMGMSMLDAAVVYEELGRGIAPSPHFVSAVLAATALLRGGSPEQQAEWLPRIASGEAILTVAWNEPGNGYGPDGVQLAARVDGDAVVLDGTKWHVPFASAATALLVLARTGEGSDGVDLFLIDPSAAGVSMEQQFTVASDTQYAVAFDGVRVPSSARLGAAGSGWATWADVVLDGEILLAAHAVGGASYALEITVQYAKDREQFDKPLGAFQAISHYLADASTRVDGARILAYEAAWARSEGRPVHQLAPMAKLFAGETFRDVTAMGEQVFGGVGFTLEYDIQLFFRRAKAAQLNWGDDRHLEEQVASAVLD
jgi:alkylation response protein AidB-like acyl-CoA dehydrogenase